MSRTIRTIRIIRIIRIILLGGLVLVFVLAFMELIVGYVTFAKRIEGGPALFMWAQGFFVSKEKRSAQQDFWINTSTANPFFQVQTSGPILGQKIHPFIDFTNAQLKDPDVVVRDYFGFRNEKDIYFERPEGTLIVLTGGSEAMGFSHRISIANHLEKFLAQRWERPVTVLNLAMNSYTLSNEINAFVHLAYHLKPNYVISYSGWNDMVYGPMIPERFKTLGLNYLKQMELWWLPRLYELRDRSYRDPFVLNAVGFEKLVPAYFENLRKYRTIVTGAQAKFIPVVQAHNPTLPSERREYYRLVHEQYARLLKEGARLSIKTTQDLPDLVFEDTVHTTEASSQKIAEFLASLVQ